MSEMLYLIVIVLLGKFIGHCRYIFLTRNISGNFAINLCQTPLPLPTDNNVLLLNKVLKNIIHNYQARQDPTVIPPEIKVEDELIPRNKRIEKKIEGAFKTAWKKFIDAKLGRDPEYLNAKTPLTLMFLKDQNIGDDFLKYMVDGYIKMTAEEEEEDQDERIASTILKELYEADSKTEENATKSHKEFSMAETINKLKGKLWDKIRNKPEQNINNPPGKEEASKKLMFPNPTESKRIHLLNDQPLITTPEANCRNHLKSYISNDSFGNKSRRLFDALECVNFYLIQNNFLQAKENISQFISNNQAIIRFLRDNPRIPINKVYDKILEYIQKSLIKRYEKTNIGKINKILNMPSSSTISTIVTTTTPKNSLITYQWKAAKEKEISSLWEKLKKIIRSDNASIITSTTAAPQLNFFTTVPFDTLKPKKVQNSFANWRSFADEMKGLGFKRDNFSEMSPKTYNLEDQLSDETITIEDWKVLKHDMSISSWEGLKGLLKDGSYSEVTKEEHVDVPKEKRVLTRALGKVDSLRRLNRFVFKDENFTENSGDSNTVNEMKNVGDIKINLLKSLRESLLESYNVKPVFDTETYNDEYFLNMWTKLMEFLEKNTLPKSKKYLADNTEEEVYRLWNHFQDAIRNFVTYASMSKNKNTTTKPKHFNPFVRTHKPTNEPPKDDFYRITNEDIAKILRELKIHHNSIPDDITQQSIASDDIIKQVQTQNNELWENYTVLLHFLKDISKGRNRSYRINMADSIEMIKNMLTATDKDTMEKLFNTHTHSRNFLYHINKELESKSKGTISNQNFYSSTTQKKIVVYPTKSNLNFQQLYFNEKLLQPKDSGIIQIDLNENNLENQLKSIKRLQTALENKYNHLPVETLSKNDDTRKQNIFINLDQIRNSLERKFNTTTASPVLNEVIESSDLSTFLNKIFKPKAPEQTVVIHNLHINSLMPIPGKGQSKKKKHKGKRNYTNLFDVKEESISTKELRESYSNSRLLRPEIEENSQKDNPLESLDFLRNDKKDPNPFLPLLRSNSTGLNIDEIQNILNHEVKNKTLPPPTEKNITKKFDENVLKHLIENDDALRSLLNIVSSKLQDKYNLTTDPILKIHRTSSGTLHPYLNTLDKENDLTFLIGLLTETLRNKYKIPQEDHQQKIQPMNDQFLDEMKNTVFRRILPYRNDIKSRAPLSVPNNNRLLHVLDNLTRKIKNKMRQGRKLKTTTESDISIVKYNTPYLVNKLKEILVNKYKNVADYALNHRHPRSEDGDSIDIVMNTTELLNPRLIELLEVENDNSYIFYLLLNSIINIMTESAEGNSIKYGDRPRTHHKEENLALKLYKLLSKEPEPAKENDQIMFPEMQTNSRYGEANVKNVSVPFHINNINFLGSGSENLFNGKDPPIDVETMEEIKNIINSIQPTKKPLVAKINILNNHGNLSFSKSYKPSDKNRRKHNQILPSKKISNNKLSKSKSKLKQSDEAIVFQQNKTKKHNSTTTLASLKNIKNRKKKVVKETKSLKNEISFGKMYQENRTNLENSINENIFNNISNRSFGGEMIKISKNIFNENDNSSINHLMGNLIDSSVENDEPVTEVQELTKPYNFMLKNTENASNVVTLNYKKSDDVELTFDDLSKSNVKISSHVRKKNISDSKIFKAVKITNDTTLLTPDLKDGDMKKENDFKLCSQKNIDHRLIRVINFFKNIADIKKGHAKGNIKGKLALLYVCIFCEIKNSQSSSLYKTFVLARYIPRV